MGTGNDMEGIGIRGVRKIDGGEGVLGLRPVAVANIDHLLDRVGLLGSRGQHEMKGQTALPRKIARP